MIYFVSWHTLYESFEGERESTGLDSRLRLKRESAINVNHEARNAPAQDLQ